MGRRAQKVRRVEDVHDGRAEMSILPDSANFRDCNSFLHCASIGDSSYQNQNLGLDDFDMTQQIRRHFLDLGR